MNFNNDQKKAIDAFLSGENIFLDGPGGVGKSYVMEHMMKLREGRCIALAPTAIAALNVGAATIHSFFKFPIGYLYDKRRKTVNQKIIDLFQKGKITTVFVDEISMVRADLFVAMDMNLRRAMRKNIPFGGLQIVVCGDFYQIPPVLNQYNEEGRLFLEEFPNEFCFCTQSWNDANFVHVKLNKIMRQSDEELITNLNNIRVRNEQFRNSINYFNERSDIDLDDPVVLCTTNAAAHNFSQMFYEELTTQEVTYKGTISNYPQSDCVVPEWLKLKVGSKVLCRANTEDMINGETGYVKQLHKDYVVVEKTNGTEVIVGKHKWINYDYTESEKGIQVTEVGYYEQIPLQLGYAITVHKSQGLTLEQVALHTGKGCFASGQLYVALSRVKTYEGLSVLNPLRQNDVIIHPAITHFYKNFKSTNITDLFED